MREHVKKSCKNLEGFLQIYFVSEFAHVKKILLWSSCKVGSICEEDVKNR